MDEQPAHRKRCKRWDEPWGVHYLTFSCFQRRPFLAKDRPRRWFLDSLERVRIRRPFDLWGYVIMPEHVHLLIQPHEGVTVSAILQPLKLPVAQRAILWLKREAPEFLPQLLDAQPKGDRAYWFWQRGGGYDRNMRSARDTHEKLRYIHDNPVRRKLAARPEEWPWSSAQAWATGVDEPLRIDRESFPPLELTKPWEH